MDPEEYRKHGHQLVDWIADYLENTREYPVRAQVRPGEIAAQIPAAAPEHGEPFEAIFEDFKSRIMPGMTHWQHPRFFAYFPTNASVPSQLAEMLMAGLGINAMLWETSPAATELEERMMDWLKGLMHLPESWSGVIQDTASTATFVACLMARERATRGAANEAGLMGQKPLAIYTSTEAHSSVEKAVRMAGMGRLSIRNVATGADGGMRPADLRQMIRADRADGVQPVMIVATVGGTGTGTMDPLREIGEIAGSEDVFLHVDAAWAGSAMLCPEFRPMLDGVELADSYVFNPHKWMLTNFDCTAHFVRDKEALIRTLQIKPAYLQTREGDTVTDFRDWGPQLGRRFRALKLWFVLRSYGAEAIRTMIKNHVTWAHNLAKIVDQDPDFELTSPVNLALFTFRYAPEGYSGDAIDALNESLLLAVNDDGRTYLTRTLIDGRPVIRIQIGHTRTVWQDVEVAWQAVRDMAQVVK